MQQSIQNNNNQTLVPLINFNVIKFISYITDTLYKFVYNFCCYMSLTVCLKSVSTSAIFYPNGISKYEEYALLTNRKTYF